MSWLSAWHWGSTRGHILRQLVTEALLLSLLGGGLGLAGGAFLLAALSRWRPVADFPVQLAVSAGPQVYLLALVLAILCGVFFGMVPAMQVLRGDPYHAIKSGQVTTSLGRRWSLRDVLLMVQIVLCSVIVTASWFQFVDLYVRFKHVWLSAGGCDTDLIRPEDGGL